MRWAKEAARLVANCVSKQCDPAKLLSLLGFLYFPVTILSPTGHETSCGQAIPPSSIILS
jgi:hypothetical protein